ncbi:MAG: IS66 family insertion sequence element accessory protein TnpB [Bacteroidales bacterium]|nr:IS66 family insertion sequence element accessory protein TnpB [Bacteroidales bacterium]
MLSVISARYFLYQEPTDMRKSFDGLCGLVSNKLGQNPMSGDLFIFVNKPRNRIKMLRWETGGFVLFYKRLEQGTFHLPKASTTTAGKLIIDYSELVMIINGIWLEKARKNKRFYQQNNVDKL